MSSCEKEHLEVGVRSITQCPTFECSLTLPKHLIGRLFQILRRSDGSLMSRLGMTGHQEKPYKLNLRGSDWSPEAGTRSMRYICQEDSHRRLIQPPRSLSSEPAQKFADTRTKIINVHLLLDLQPPALNFT